MLQGLVWDLFCRVVDNYGDIGVCWRLACDLATRGHSVRLWTDDRSALAWMAPDGQPGVEVLTWLESPNPRDCGDVVIEAFGCALPEQHVSRMRVRRPTPVWVNLEHLTAERYALRCHGLPSPQLSGIGVGLTKWFYYPGFSAGTGGLIRESDLETRQRLFDASAWLATHGIASRGGERRVSLFCYAGVPVPALLDILAGFPTLLLAISGPAARQVDLALGPERRQGELRCVALPLLTQKDYDCLLWASDLNFVRGEDSWVRAQWAGRPFIWQPYVQHDGVHITKLDAFLDMHLRDAVPDLRADVQRAFEAWNGVPGATLILPPLEPWREHSRRWGDSLRAQLDLATSLIQFVSQRR
jgi:uncharacterized repeat protein (TIGR03837 family)